MAWVPDQPDTDGLDDWDCGDTPPPPQPPPQSGINTDEQLLAMIITNAIHNSQLTAAMHQNQVQALGTIMSLGIQQMNAAMTDRLGKVGIDPSLFLSARNT